MYLKRCLRVEAAVVTADPVPIEDESGGKLQEQGDKLVSCNP